MPVFFGRGQRLETFAAQCLGQQLFAQGLRFGLRQGFEVLADFGARPTGAHKTQPGRIRLRGGLGSDFHHVTVFEFGAQGFGFLVDARRHHPLAHPAVDRVRKVHHRGPARQRQDLAFGREHVDRIGEQIAFDMVPKFGSIAGFVLDVQERLQPLGS